MKPLVVCRVIPVAGRLNPDVHRDQTLEDSLRSGMPFPRFTPFMTLDGCVYIVSIRSLLDEERMKKI